MRGTSILTQISTVSRFHDDFYFYHCSDTTLEKTMRWELCPKQCAFAWKDVNAISNEYIIHKHTLRDRTEVIAERNEQLQKESRDNKLLISAFTNVYFVQALYTFCKNLLFAHFRKL